MIQKYAGRRRIPDYVDTLDGFRAIAAVLVIAIGCTGGAHRSVAIAERLGEFLRAKGYQVTVTHRALALEQAHWKSSQEAE